MNEFTTDSSILPVLKDKIENNCFLVENKFSLKHLCGKQQTLPNKVAVFPSTVQEANLHVFSKLDVLVLQKNRKVNIWCRSLPEAL